MGKEARGRFGGEELEKKAGGLAPSLCIRPLQASWLTPEEVITAPLG